MRKVYVKVETRLILNIEEGTSVEDVLGEMNYDFAVSEEYQDQATLEDTEITDWQIQDSK